MRPYLHMMLDGTKTVECRLTMQARAPFDGIEPGERIYFKQSAGPYRATAIVEEVLFEQGLTPKRVRELKRDYNDLIGGDDAFWHIKRNSNFATLMWLTDVREIDCGPAIRPLQGVAWLTLDDEPAWRRRDDFGCSFTIDITEGNLRNNTLYATKVIDHFPPDCLGGRTQSERGTLMTLHLHGGKTVRTDIVGPRKLFRTRIWGAWLRDHDAHPGDRVVFQPMGKREFHVGLLGGAAAKRQQHSRGAGAAQPRQ